MKKIDWARHAPPGISARRELCWIAAGLGAGLLYSLGFILRLYSQYQSLFHTDGKIKILSPDAQMPDFSAIFDGTLPLFGVFAVFLATLLFYHYLYHYQGTKSIYLMRRLPNPWELHRRCITVPLFGMAAALLLAGLLLVLYYYIYMNITPAACLTPNQWAKIWIYGGH